MASEHARRRAATFAATVGWTLLTTLIPPVGLIRSGLRRTGVVLLGLGAGGLIGLVAVGLTRREALLSLGVHPDALHAIGIGLGVVAVGWVLAIVLTHVRLRPLPVRAPQRILGAFLVLVLSFVVAAPMAVGARYTYSQADLVDTVFGGNTPAASATPNAWQQQGRLNVLLLGGDAGADRVGIRTDTVMVASIDTNTGDTVLFGLPRNTARMPFPKGPLRDAYPNGWYDGYDPDDAEYFLNSMYSYVPAQHPELFTDDEHAGGDVLKASVGEALGLEIDYYATINLDGFERLINAMGGVTVNVNTYVAMGGSTDKGIPPKKWLSPGPDQHLDGHDALWFARGRYGADDYQRMARQRCVMHALADQANVPTLLTRYEAISREFQQVITTDLPTSQVPAVLDLALLMREGNMRSIVFTHGKNGFSSTNPDFDLVRKQVKQAIDESHRSDAPASAAPTKAADSPSPKPTASKKPSATRSPKASATPTSDASDDVRDACAYDPAAAQEALDNPPAWVH